MCVLNFLVVPFFQYVLIKEYDNSAISREDLNSEPFLKPWVCSKALVQFLFAQQMHYDLSFTWFLIRDNFQYLFILTKKLGS